MYEMRIIRSSLICYCCTIKRRSPHWLLYIYISFAPPSNFDTLRCRHLVYCIGLFANETKYMDVLPMEQQKIDRERKRSVLDGSCLYSVPKTDKRNNNAQVIGCDMLIVILT